MALTSSGCVATSLEMQNEGIGKLHQRNAHNSTFKHPVRRRARRRATVPFPWYRSPAADLFRPSVVHEDRWVPSRVFSSRLTGLLPPLFLFSPFNILSTAYQQLLEITPLPPSLLHEWEPPFLFYISIVLLNMASAIAPAPTRVYQGGRRETYGQLRYLHESSEKRFITWVTSHSTFLQNVDGRIWLQTFEREFYRIDERLPRNIVDELVAIVGAGEKAKEIHMAEGTHDEGYENCLQMYTYFLRKAKQQLASPSPSPPPSPKVLSEDEFPSLGSLPSPPSPPPAPDLTPEGSLPSPGSPSPVLPTRGNSTKRRFSAAAIYPAPTTPSAPALVAASAVSAAKKPRLVLKLGSAWQGRSAISLC